MCDGLFGRNEHNASLSETFFAARLADYCAARHLAEMVEYLQQAWDFHIWVVVAITGAAVAVISSVADWRRQRRKRLDAVGFMPWTAISLFSIGLTFVSVAFAIKAG
jgi:hypothetical protein